MPKIGVKATKIDVQSSAVSSVSVRSVSSAVSLCTCEYSVLWFFGVVFGLFKPVKEAPKSAVVTYISYDFNIEQVVRLL